MKQKELIRKLGSIFPLASQDFWDFSGWQLGWKDPEKEIRKIYLCLDFSEFCTDSLLEFSPDIVITHHPFYFGTRRNVCLGDEKKEKLSSWFEKLGISLYSYHTPFDKGKEGMNESLLRLIGYDSFTKGEDPYIRTVKLEGKIPLSSLVQEIRDRLGFESLDYFDNTGGEVSSFSILAGSGANYFRTAIEYGSDCYVSGDSKLNNRLDMSRYGISFIELPHEAEEKGFLFGMKKALLKIDPTFEIYGFEYEIKSRRNL